MYRIFIVEDDPGIAAGMAQLLRSWDMETVTVSDFRSIPAEFAACQPHLVLMDISLPFMNGYHWCSQLRQVSKVPILFLSSASDNMNIIMAMNMGAMISLPSPLTVMSWWPKFRPCCGAPIPSAKAAPFWNTGARC